MRFFSKGSIYVLRALLYIASRGPETGYTSIGEMSEKLDISFHFLTKTFQTLSKANIVDSYRGPHGGIALKRPANEIYLIELVTILEGADFFDKCLLGLPGCGIEKPCPVHDFWKITKEAIKKEFSHTTLAELGQKVSDERMRLGD